MTIHTINCQHGFSNVMTHICYQQAFWGEWPDCIDAPDQIPCGSTIQIFEPHNKEVIAASRTVFRPFF